MPGAWLLQAVLRARHAEKCTIRTSYSASVRTGEADESCSKGAGGEGVLGFPHRGSGGLGAAEDGVFQDRPAGAVTFIAPVLKTGSGRQGHSWVRIPPPPLLEPRTAWLSRRWRLTDSLFVTFVDPPQSAEIRCPYTWGAQRGRKSVRWHPAARPPVPVQTRPLPGNIAQERPNARS